jgi:glycosyltransferase involved in cell wall biosynthesis
VSLVIVRPYPYGGGDSLALLTSVARYGRIPDVTFLYTRGDGTEWRFLEGSPIRFVHCRDVRIRFGANLISLLKGVEPWLHRGAVVDVAEVGNGYSAQVVRAARRAGIPSIVSVLETHQGRIWDVLPPFSIYTRYVLRHATAFRVLTERSERYLRHLGVLSSRIARIPIGVDLEMFRPATAPRDDGEVRLLFARRLEPKNGVALLLRAFAELHARLPRLRLWVAGDGPSRSLVESTVPGSAVTYLGRVSYPALAEVYRSVDVFCNPATDSRRLGRVVHEDGQFTFPLLESQASGLKVISSESGSNAELVAPTNAFIPQGDLTALIASIARIYEGPAPSSRSDENRKWVERRFSAATLQPEMDALVQRLGG